MIPKSGSFGSAEKRFAHYPGAIVVGPRYAGRDLGSAM